jgi:hypothetical protein
MGYAGSKFGSVTRILEDPKKLKKKNEIRNCIVFLIRICVYCLGDNGS